MVEGVACKCWTKLKQWAESGSGLGVELHFYWLINYLHVQVVIFAYHSKLFVKNYGTIRSLDICILLLLLYMMSIIVTYECSQV